MARRRYQHADRRTHGDAQGAQQQRLILDIVNRTAAHVAHLTDGAASPVAHAARRRVAVVVEIASRRLATIGKVADRVTGIRSERDTVIARPAFAAVEPVPPAGANYTSPMTYIDDLEEYDAELELRLKREYATVFGLFRYCVLTAEATYLCNELDIQRNDQAAYPFARADDDRRLGLGQEPPDPHHSAYRGAHHPGRHHRGAEARRRHRDHAAARVRTDRRIAMLLAIDVGNTQTVVGLYDGELLSDHWRVASVRTQTADELAVELHGLLSVRGRASKT